MNRNLFEHRRPLAPGLPTPDAVPSIEHVARSDSEQRDAVAALYDGAGDSYGVYADGDAVALFSFDGAHSYADRYVWNVIENELVRLAESGRKSLRILDAGCGPGAWLRRLVTRASALGFKEITARGFDIAESQVRRARTRARELQDVSGVNLTFEVADLTEPMPETDSSVDITLCLFSVLSHLAADQLDDVLKEFARVTAGCVIATVRPIGGPPTAFVSPVEKARSLNYDHSTSVCDIKLQDGRTSSCCFHLFTPAEIEACFARHLKIRTLIGLDLVHTRFRGDPRWNPPESRASPQLLGELDRLEVALEKNGLFLPYAAHLLIVAGRVKA